MTVDRLLARARADVLRLAPSALARGAGYAILVSLDGEGQHHCGVFAIVDIVGMMGLDEATARRAVDRESGSLRPGRIRVIVISGGSPVVVVFALESGEEAINHRTLSMACRQPLAQPRHRGRTASDLEATGPSHPDMDLDARTDVRFRVLGVLR